MRAALAVMALSASPALALDDLPRGLASVVAGRQAPALPAIGAIVPPYPDDLTSLGGACVGPLGSATECALVAATLDPAGGGGPVALYSEQQAGDDAEGLPLWTVTDVSTLPSIPEGHFLNYGTCRTELAGLHPVAVMRSGGGKITPEIGAWIAALDRDSGRFVEIAPAAVTCESLLP